MARKVNAGLDDTEGSAIADKSPDAGLAGFSAFYVPSPI